MPPVTTWPEPRPQEASDVQAERSSLAHDPAAQSVQVASLVEPVSVPYWVGGHKSQDPAPGEGLYDPAGQSEHVGDASPEYFPGLQSVVLEFFLC